MEANIIVDLSEFPDFAAGYVGATAEEIVAEAIQTVSSLGVDVIPDLSNEGRQSSLILRLL